MTAKGLVQTTDMTLAVVLACQGYSPVMSRRNGGPEVVWTVPAGEVDAAAEELVRTYDAGACRVEPRRFSREWKRVREDMYRFLGVSNRPQGQPLRDATGS